MVKKELLALVSCLAGDHLSHLLPVLAVLPERQLGHLDLLVLPYDLLWPAVPSQLYNPLVDLGDARAAALLHTIRNFCNKEINFSFHTFIDFNSPMIKMPRKISGGIVKTTIIAQQFIAFLYFLSNSYTSDKNK